MQLETLCKTQTSPYGGLAISQNQKGGSKARGTLHPYFIKVSQQGTIGTHNMARTANHHLTAMRGSLCSPNDQCSI